MGQPLLSLIVLSFRRFSETTGPCLATLHPQANTPQAELLLVDNGSDDGSQAACAAFAGDHADVRYLPQSRNLGFGGGMNAGVAAARGQWVVLVNSDTLFPPGAIEALSRTLDQVDGSVAMIGPVTNSAGNGQGLPLPGASLAQAIRIGAEAMQAPTGLLTPTYRTDFFCVAIRKAAWDALAGLDPVFGLGYYEDFDFSLRLRAAGFEQVIAEDVFVVHVGSAVFSSLGDQQRQLLKRNRQILEERHPHVRFEHVREGNANVLARLLQTAHAQGWSAALKRRAAWRMAALLKNEPRSPLKRWRWRWKQRGLVRELRAAGIRPEFPTLLESNPSATTDTKEGEKT
jgi:GT2 family glycosyltransferase